MPVIGNGDIVDGTTAKKMMDETGCDGIMIGRAARGNPFIFNQVKKYLEDGTVVEKPGMPQIRDMILRHCRMLIEEKGDYTGIREMRKHVAWYTAGYPHSAEIRRKVNMIESYEALEQLMNIH